MKWIVKIVKPIPLLNDNYPGGFFPRVFHYKADAEKLAEDVKANGGEAIVSKELNTRKRHARQD